MSDPLVPQEIIQGARRPPWEVAGLPAPPYARAGLLLPRHWLREVRTARGLTLWEVAQGVTAHTPESRLSLSRLSHLEAGRLSLSKVDSCHMEGLRLVLAVPVSIWQKVFGAPP